MTFVHRNTDVTLSVGLVFVLVGCVTFEPSGRVSTRTTKMPDVIPQIEKGKTTRADLIGKLGDPTSQSRDSEGNETLMFIEKAAIWEGGA